MLPPTLRLFFWDVNAESFEPLAFPEYTIARILEYGDAAAVAWLKETFTETQIKDVIRSERRLTRRSANFWASVYGIPVEEVAALNGAPAPF